MKSGKEYVALMHLHKEVSEEKLRQGFKKFTGPIQQMPPIKSSVKRELRTRNIYNVNILEIDRQDVLFTIFCQSGTYVRKWIHDVGQYLGIGAHMAQLRRTRAGCFDESTLATLQELADAYHFYKQGDDKMLRKIIQPVESAIINIPKIWVFDSAVEPLCHGQKLKLPGISKFESGINTNDFVALMTLKDELIGLGIAAMDSRMMLDEKGIAVKTDKVFMQPGTYTLKK